MMSVDAAAITADGVFFFWANKVAQIMVMKDSLEKMVSPLLVGVPQCCIRFRQGRSGVQKSRMLQNLVNL